MMIFGASGHAKVILDILFASHIEVDKIVDESPQTEQVFGVPVAQCERVYPPDTAALIAIGSNVIRKKIAEQYPLQYTTAVHPSTTVSPFSEVGPGTVIMARAVVNPAAVIGQHCIINTAAVVEHDCILENYVHVSPNAALAGNVTVGEGSHIGIGACVIQGITIGKWCTIGAGAVVIRDIPDGATVVGNPGRIL